MNDKNIKLGDWTSLQKDAQAIRYAVFVVEQKIQALFKLNLGLGFISRLGVGGT